ncbi:hypothetical protein DACRYDRAFT_117046 [Dacryopinax primogenitus]|uniref:Uncharacterized protein n=1 Tax=Dacryopinax primogenitus (strain DJM 731) TaxID=1858805 RepID=M5G3Y0_DACPD|nr:uncharacterized protein DACRYDRAFT_117046 [Dacryopinax primogenitus]EJU00552.1 hypothetical protein DACRYDRAFT_117046 [Dacryopinax primogenitus]
MLSHSWTYQSLVHDVLEMNRLWEPSWRCSECKKKAFSRRTRTSSDLLSDDKVDLGELEKELKKEVAISHAAMTNLAAAAPVAQPSNTTNELFRGFSSLSNRLTERLKEGGLREKRAQVLAELGSQQH